MFSFKPVHRAAGAALQAGRRARLLSAVALAMLVALGPPAAVFARQQDEAITSLREQIAALEVVEKGEDTPTDVRAINRGFLNERRARLRDLLKGRSDAMRDYLRKLGPQLTANERQSVEKTVQSLAAEIEAIETSLRGKNLVEVASASGLVVDPQPSRLAPLRDAEGAHGPRARRGTDTASGATPAAVAALAAPQPLLTPPDCYPDAPAAVIETARLAAATVVENFDPANAGPDSVSTDVRANFFALLFLTIAHAVSVDSTDVEAERRDLINKLDIAIARAETKRTDKQVGASATSEGSTSAAEKTGIPELLGFAIEHGAIQKEVSGTALTLSTSPYALALAGHEDTASTYKEHGYLSRVGVSATFNINDENDLLASARRKQLSEWSVRARLLGDRSARSADAEAEWDKIREQFTGASRAIQSGIVDIFQRDAVLSPALETKRREIVGRFTEPAFLDTIRTILRSGAADDQKIAQITERILCRARTEIFDQVRSNALGLSPAMRERILTTSLPQYAQALTAKKNAITAFEAGLERIAGKPALTFAYTNKREAVGSDFSTFKLLFAAKTKDKLDIIANAGFSLYHKPDPALNQQSARDFSAAISFEGKAGRSPFMLADLDESRITFAFTGRYQRMFENRGVAGRKSDIAVGQFKIEVPIFMGMSLPFSVTYANATELVKEDHIRANFGFTIDMDKLRQALLLSALKKVQ